MEANMIEGPHGLQIDAPERVSNSAADKYVEQAHAERLVFLIGAKEYGLAVVRSLFLLNGGAILALLTFDGSMFSRSEASNDAAGRFFHAVSPAMTCFIFGLCFTVATAATAYVNAFLVAHQNVSASALIAWRLGTPVKDRPKWWGWLTDFTVWFGVFLALASLSAFIKGAQTVSSAVDSKWPPF